MDIGDGYNVWMISWIVGVGRDVSVNSLSFFIYLAKCNLTTVWSSTRK